MIRPLPLLPATTLLSLLLACGAPPPEAETSDTREPVRVPMEAQDAIRAEMNTMLGSINRIAVALPRRDTAAIREAAVASGVANAADPTLEKLLPEKFLTLGMQAHRGFDALAASLDQGFNPDTTIAQLGQVTQACVTCHATYRLALP